MMQLDRRDQPRLLFFAGPLLILLAIAAAVYARQNALVSSVQETPAPLVVPSGQRRLKEPLPTLKALSNLPVAARGPVPHYRVQALPTDFEASDLSDTGIVVGNQVVNPGSSQSNMEVTAMFWQSGRMTRLPGDKEMRCYAEAVNASGTIVGNIGGWSEFPGGDSGSDAAIWQASSPRRKVHRSQPISVVAHPSLRMTRINRWGQFIGTAGPGCSADLTALNFKSQEYNGVSYGDIAGASQLSFFQNGTQTCIIGSDSLNDLNDLGQVVGWKGIQQFEVKGESAERVSQSPLSLFCQRAMLYEGAYATMLWQDTKVADASAINNKGEVVGVQGIAPVLWKNGVLTHLQTLSGTGSGSLRDINDYSQIVGACGPEEHQQAVLWQNKQPYDLNHRLVGKSRVFLTQATRINQSGQILACDRNLRWYLLTPTRSNK